MFHVAMRVWTDSRRKGGGEQAPSDILHTKSLHPVSQTSHSRNMAAQHVHELLNTLADRQS